MKRENYYILAIAILSILLLFSFIDCEGDEYDKTTVTEKPIKVLIPEQKGIFEKPTNQSEIPSAKKDSIIYFDKIIYVQSEVDKKLVNEYNSAKDSISKLNIFLNSIRKREYVSTFDDEFVNIKAHSTVKGELEDTKLSYTLKPREVEVIERTITKEKTIQSKLALFAGANIGSNKNLNTVVPGAEIGVMINNNTMITGGYNTDGDWTAGLKIRILNKNK